MPIARMVALLTCILVVGILGCGDSEEERKTQALNAAQSWAEETTENTELVIAEIVTLVTNDVPGAYLLSGVIAEQIVEQLAWNYSEPVKTTENLYTVSATVSAQATLDFPLIGSKTYAARLPIDLEVDVSTGSVSEWSADLDNASVGEK